MRTKDSPGKKNKNKIKTKDSPKKSVDLDEDAIETENDRFLEKKRKRKKEKNVGIDKDVHSIKTGKRKKKVKNDENNDALSTLSIQVDDEISESLNEQSGRRKKARKTEKDRSSSKKSEESLEKEATRNEASRVSSANDGCLKRKKGKSKEAKKQKKKDKKVSKATKSQENEVGVSEDDVYIISSGDEDCSKGMKKWISQHHESRPGLEILQQRIDEFITAHEEKLEQERKEREARIAEEGWTIVTHHKGRKKTTDAETGTTVGSVAQVVAEDKLAQKKSKRVGPDFYRFQKKEAHRNDIMTLQSKFKEDMKRLQQLRAARKFRPY